MVKNDWANLGFTSIVWGFCALIWGALFLTSLNDENKWNFLFDSVMYLAPAIYTFVQAQRWKPMNYRRQMAAYWGFAARVPLAAAHPLPNVAALPLPFAIILRPGWPRFVIGLGTLAALSIYTDTYNYRVHGIHLININPFVIDPFIIPVFLWGLLIALWLRSQRIEVTQEGLIVRHATGWLHGTNTIRWHDARLFAIRGGKPGTPGTRYELSSPYTVVQWTRTRGRWWSFHRPAIPFAEYDAQMEALIALISGITGLPLYDVR